MRVSSLGICFSLFSLISSNALAQRAHYLPDKVGVWKPFQMSCSDSGHGLAAEQNRLYSAKLFRLSEAIHQAQVFHPPVGINAVPTGCVNATIEFLDDYPAARSGPVPGYLMVGTFSYALTPTNQVSVADEGPHFFVDVNSMVRLYSGAGEAAHDEQGKIFAAPEIARTESGFPLYRNGCIVITRVPRPIFAPVSAERFLLARIRQARLELTDLQKRHQEYVGAKAEQRMQETYQRIRARNAQDADRYLATAQQAERQSDVTFTKSEQAKQAEIAGYQSELDSLSPEQRQAQAYTAQQYNGPPKGRLLAIPGEAGVWPLVAFNPEFFDRSRPRTDIQSLVIGRLYERDYREKSYDPQYQRLIDFRKSFDFQTLMPLLDAQ